MLENIEIRPERITLLNDMPEVDGDYVLYWMQGAIRSRCNHALEMAVEVGNNLGLPVVCVFVVMDGYPEANARHYGFMLEGLADVESGLAKRGIDFAVLHGDLVGRVLEVAGRAAVVVTDDGYTKIQRGWRGSIADAVGCMMVEVCTNVVVPVVEVSGKQEYAARTIRPKIMRLVEEYLRDVGRVNAGVLGYRLDVERFDVSDVSGALMRLDVDRSVGVSETFRGGESEAGRLLDDFVEKKLLCYDSDRNDPTIAGTSEMSPYLHFGMISPIEIGLKVVGAKNSRNKESVDAFIEQLVVRRELAFNYAYFNRDYDSYNGLPEWARKTLAEHGEDKREYVYSVADYENCLTHDRYWNAAQREMVRTGKMHNYMRMYWGKKIIEWSGCAEEAFEIAIYLNNKYELDGRDPNGYVGVAWCFGLHDRPWARRKVFGTVRYMNAAGLKRKFDVDKYAEVNSVL